MELIMWHDGRNWIVENDEVRLSSPTIDGIDAEVGNFMRQRGLVRRGMRARVKMLYDNSTIPQWMRPYAQHYFNRILEVEG
jgi:hypothetical protein